MDDGVEGQMARVKIMEKRCLVVDRCCLMETVVMVSYQTWIGAEGAQRVLGGGGQT